MNIVILVVMLVAIASSVIAINVIYRELKTFKTNFSETTESAYELITVPTRKIKKCLVLYGLAIILASFSFLWISLSLR